MQSKFLITFVGATVDIRPVYWVNLLMMMMKQLRKKVYH